MASCRAWWNKFTSLRFIITVEPVMLLYISATTLNMPLLQQYMYSEVSKAYNFTATKSEGLCGEINSRNVTNGSLPHFTNTESKLYELENKVQTATSHWILYLNMANSIPAVFTSSMYGPWSDKVGRKPVLIIALIGEILNALAIISIVKFGLPYYLLFIGSAVAGLGGSYGAMVAAVLSYTADNTDTSHRALRIGIVESMIYLGAMVGFFVSGVWKQGSGGYAQPFWGVLVLLGVNLLYVLLILPQSQREATTDLKRSKPVTCDNIKNVLMLFREDKWLLFGLGAFFFSTFAWFGDITILYVKASPLCWNSTTIGYFMALQTVVVAIGTVVTLKLLHSLVSDTFLVVAGVVSTIAGGMIKTFADTTALMFWSIAPYFLAGLPNPCLRSLMSKMVPSSKQGALFTAVAVTEVSSKLIAPAIFNIVYPISRTSMHFPGFCFALVAGFVLIATFFLIPFCCVKGDSISPDLETEYESLTPPIPENEQEVDLIPSVSV